MAAANASIARFEAAEAEARRAANELEYAVLKIDADGTVMEAPADAGQVVAVGQVVVRLTRDGTREAVVNGEQAQRIYIEISYQRLVTLG